MTVRGLAPKTVLLVEQDEPSRGAFKRALTDVGLAVLCFPDYAGALNVAESEQRLDLLITGVRLPVGTPHGVALAAMVHLRRPRLPVLFLAEDDALAEMIGDRSPVLVKPIDPAGLARTAARLLGEPLANQGLSPT